MRSYAYKQDSENYFVGMSTNADAEELAAYCISHVPLGCPFFLLSDEDVAELGTTPPEAITFDESQADGIGEAE